MSEHAHGNRLGWCAAGLLLFLAGLILTPGAPVHAANTGAGERPVIAAYYFPNYHVDPRNEAVHGEGWTEWQIIKYATPRFPGHRQPLIPLWGYEDEADPRVMEKKIDAAADHGIDLFIIDWYWFDDGPFLERCLNEGYLKARNNGRVKFALMWANHDWSNSHPRSITFKPEKVLLYPGQVTPKTFDIVTDHVIKDYFTHPSYFKIDGRPYYSIYDLSKFMASFGTVAEARKALDGFRAKAVKAGFPGLHLNVIAQGLPVLPGDNAPANLSELAEQLGFDSINSYCWIHHVALKQFPSTPYETMRDTYFETWKTKLNQSKVPYFPNVSIGWDSTPRFVQSDIITEKSGYGRIVTGNTPAAFKKALEMARDRMKGTRPNILTINAWNEWPEGESLEPDTFYKMGYLEAVRDVFGLADGSQPAGK